MRAEWGAPPGVHALTTTRQAGVSQGVYRGLNLGDHVQDDPAAVARNRLALRGGLTLPGEPVWLHQVHGTRVVPAREGTPPETADGSFTGTRGRVCGVLTADCLPVLFCNRAGTRVAAAHAGWRGLAAGILEATLTALAAAGAAPDTLLAWLGPAIGPGSYEVGDEVRDAFLRADPAAESAFVAGRAGHWWLNLYAAARLRLHRGGVPLVTGGDHCTWTEADRFYSHRRDGLTGRQATLIWLGPEAA